jgi:hypothetical protein
VLLQLELVLVLPLLELVPPLLVLLQPELVQLILTRYQVVFLLRSFFILIFLKDNINVYN